LKKLSKLFGALLIIFQTLQTLRKKVFDFFIFDKFSNNFSISKKKFVAWRIIVPKVDQRAKSVSHQKGNTNYFANRSKTVSKRVLEKLSKMFGALFIISQTLQTLRKKSFLIFLFSTNFQTIFQFPKKSLPSG
jgi:hypothetical protein